MPDLRNGRQTHLPAATATIAASSKKTFDEFGMDEYVQEDYHPLNMSRAVMFPRGEGERIDTIYARLASTNDEPVEATLHLREAAESGDFSSMDDIATVTATVPPGKEGWVEFPVGRDVTEPFAWFWLPKTEGVEWMLMSKAPLGSCRSYGGSTDGKWTVRTGEHYGFATDPPIALPVEFPPENVTNGVTRIVGAAPNMWASDPAQGFPQHVELTWDKPQEINAVYLTFDTDMNAKFHTVPIPRESVRDYEVSYHDGAEWRSLATVRGNFQRRRAHHFDAVTTSKLRLTVTATNGAKSARVFEIRAYNEDVGMTQDLAERRVVGADLEVAISPARAVADLSRVGQAALLFLEVEVIPPLGRPAKLVADGPGAKTAVDLLEEQ